MQRGSDWPNVVAQAGLVWEQGPWWVDQGFIQVTVVCSECKLQFAYRTRSFLMNEMNDWMDNL